MLSDSGGVARARGGLAGGPWKSVRLFGDAGLSTPGAGRQARMSMRSDQENSTQDSLPACLPACLAAYPSSTNPVHDAPLLATTVIFASSNTHVWLWVSLSRGLFRSMHSPHPGRGGQAMASPRTETRSPG